MMAAHQFMNIRFRSAFHGKIRIVIKDGDKLEPVKLQLSLLQDFRHRHNMDLMYLRETAKVMVIGPNKQAFGPQPALLFLIHQQT